MSRPKKPAVVPFHKAPAGQPADFFVLLAEKKHGTTRDGKPFYTCRFRDRVRTAVVQVWADGPHFAACEADWHPGACYKVRGVFGEHDKYGPQVEVLQIRPVRPEDAADGFRESDLLDRSRFDPDAMFAELRTMAATELRDEPLTRLVLGLLDAHGEQLKPLPAHPRAFYPFPGGWLEHTLSVAKSCLFLADRYAAHYPELTPPLNRDLVLAGAILHDIGRAVDLCPPSQGCHRSRPSPGNCSGTSCSAGMWCGTRPEPWTA